MSLNFQVTWADIKSALANSACQLKWFDLGDRYLICAIDGPASLSTTLGKDGGAEVLEFEADYKNAQPAGVVQQVKTTFESRDLTLSCCRGVSDVDPTTGAAVFQVISPGTPGDPNGGRWVSWGEAWFTGADRHADDYIVGIEIVDVDDIYGMGAGTVLQHYHDMDVPEANRGWSMPTHYGNAEVEPIGYYGHIPAGLYLRITAQKGGTGPHTGVKFRVNIGWGRYDPS